MRTSKSTDFLDMIITQNISHTICQYFIISLMCPKVYLYIQHICIIHIIQFNALYACLKGNL